MKRQLIAGTVTGAITLCAANAVRAAEGTEGGAGHGLDPVVLAGVAVILIAAKLGGELFQRIKQPSVLGELVIGIVIGNLVLIGFTAAGAVESKREHKCAGGDRRHHPSF